MASIPFFGTILLALASAGEPGLRAERLYNSVGRPVPVEVTPPMTAVE